MEWDLQPGVDLDLLLPCPNVPRLRPVTFQPIDKLPRRVNGARLPGARVAWRRGVEPSITCTFSGESSSRHRNILICFHLADTDFLVKQTIMAPRRAAARGRTDVKVPGKS
jgi:hypothetical protein